MIEIDISPFLFSTDFVSTLALSWHGLFSFVAVATAVVLVARWAPLKQVDPDAVLSIAVWAIIGGVIGARVVHVVDHWGAVYSQNPMQVLEIWTGGIGVWGGVVGGFIAGAAYALIAKHPVGVIADLTAPALVYVQTIGRIGDIINGEHCSRATDLLFGFQWVHSGTAARNCADGFANAVHPAIAYEMIWNILALAVLWQLRGRLKPDGMIWTLYLALYAIGRFGVTFFREDRIWTAGLQEAQIIALLILAITVPILLAKARFGDRVEEAPLVVERGTRAERRRGGR
jgi:phosphatidylglycerol:prolipoprotein diacylglycerol transferase